MQMIDIIVRSSLLAISILHGLQLATCASINEQSKEILDAGQAVVFRKCYGAMPSIIQGRGARTMVQ